MMMDLRRLLESQNFESEAEVNAFMNSMIGKQIPSRPKHELSHKEQAQDLVFAAYELPPAEAKRTIEKALQLDNQCIEAYEFLASLEDIVEIALPFYEKAIAIGREVFGGDYLDEHKGSFWGFIETRPFMRCMQHYADCLHLMGRVKESVAIFEEMIELNPRDNQGVRDQLMLYLIQLDEREKFKKYSKKFKDDTMTFALFNRALFAFKTEGATNKANKQLQKALKRNTFVATKLLSKKPITDLVTQFSLGSNDEAVYFAYFAKPIWQQTDGAIAWLKNVASAS